MLYTGLLLMLAIVEIRNATITLEPVVSLIHETGAAAALLMALIVFLGLCTAPIHRRVLEPTLQWRACATFGAVDDVYHRSLGSLSTATLPRLEHAHARAGSMDPARQADQTQVAFRTASRAGAWLSIVFVPILWYTDYLTVNASWIVAAVLIVIALLIGLGYSRDAGNNHDKRIARWEIRSVVTAVSLEIIAAGGIVVALLALQHTAGVPSSGVGQALAVALIARSIVHVSPAPMGLGLADAVLVAGLIMIGASVPIAIATTLIWRVSTVIVILGQIALVNLPPQPSPPVARDRDTSSESRVGQFLHHWTFRAVGALPTFMSSAIRRHVFETMFSGGEDPWNYSTSAYESRKRNTLLGAVPPGARIILEIGCADGHNLVALAKEFPTTKIIGVDMSEAAVAIARSKSINCDNVTVVRGTAIECLELLKRYHGRIDVLILAEMLYYLGGEKAIRREISPLAQLLAPGASVVLVHGGHNTEAQHAAACSSLGVHITKNRTVEDPNRPFIVTVAATASVTAH